MSKPRLAILVSFSGQGGVERMIANLATAMVDLGVELDLLLIKYQGPHVAALPHRARHIPLRTRHTATSVFEVARYLRREQPDALLAVKHRAIIAALRARRLARTTTSIGGRLGTTVSAALADSGRLRRRQWYSAMRNYYPQLNAIIPVSEGVAQDIKTITNLPDGALTVIRNPVITPQLFELAREPVDHPFLSSESSTAGNAPPVIVSAGRLTRQKDFPTLLDAFAKVIARRDARLIILGDGGDRKAIEEQARALGVADKLSLPGFQANPWAWIQRAQVFVLSSLWEGSPNSLTEALALGVPVVSTDCPSGPSELLKGGTVAPLVPMSDSSALAQAIDSMLDKPPGAEVLQNAVTEYDASISARAYLSALGITLDN